LTFAGLSLYSIGYSEVAGEVVKMWSLAAMRFLAAVACLAICGLAAIPSHAQDLIVFAASEPQRVARRHGAGVRAREPARKCRVLCEQLGSGETDRERCAGRHLHFRRRGRMDYLATRRLIDAATRTDLLRNRLVLIAPSDSQAQDRHHSRLRISRRRSAQADWQSQIPITFRQASMVAPRSKS
jgi:hypothetical protein